MESLCKHGTPVSWCAICVEAKKPILRKPTKQAKEVRTVHAVATITRNEPATPYGSMIVSTKLLREHDDAFPNLNSTTTFVHIHGHPYLWAIKKILEKAPNLQTLQVYPTVLRHMHPDTHIALCKRRGVRIITGHWRPELCWAGENRSPFYAAQRTFFQKLEGDQKKLFDELIFLGFDEALMAARYFCLKDEEFIPQREVSTMFGYRFETEASTRINAVIYYLDQTFETGTYSTRRAQQFKVRVQRLRTILANTEWKAKLMQEMGITQFPEGMPLASLEVYQEVFKKWQKDQLKTLKAHSNKQHQVLVLRYGLEDGKFRTLKEISEIMSRVTVSAIGSIEDRALKFMGIARA